MSNPSSSSLDDALKKISDIISNSTSSTATNNTSSGGSSSTTTTTTTNPTQPGNLSMKDLQDSIIKEIRYSQMIPPLTPNLVMSVYDSLEDAVDNLKTLDQNPDLQAMIDSAILPLIQGERSAQTEDSELTSVLTQVAKRLSGDTGERSPLAVTALFVACWSAGIATGRVIYDVLH